MGLCSVAGDCPHIVLNLWLPLSCEATASLVRLSESATGGCTCPKRGRRQAPDAGRWLAANIDAINLAVVSTAKRARTTWDAVADELDQPPKTRHDDGVYAASVGELLSIVRHLDDAMRTVVLVGHNPGIEDLAETLTGDSVPMPTSALAVIELTTTWDGAGRVRGVLRAAGRPPTSAV